MTTQDVKKISIRLLPDGFSYLDQHFPILPGADFIKRLEDSMLQAFEQASTSEAAEPALEICSIESVRFCLSPRDIGDPDLFYQLCHPALDQEEELIHLTDDQFDWEMTVGIDRHLYNFLRRNISNISFTHPLYEMIGQWQSKVKETENCMIAQAEHNFLDIIIFRSKHIQFANRFIVTSSEDILYHILNCWTQNELDILKDKLYLNTNIEGITQSLKSYIKQCES